MRYIKIELRFLFILLFYAVAVGAESGGGAATDTIRISSVNTVYSGWGKNLQGFHSPCGNPVSFSTDTLPAPWYVERASVELFYDWWRQAPLAVSDDMELTAFYDDEYFVSVISDYGTTSGMGWYADGDTATASVSPEWIISDEMSYLFEGFSGALYTGGDNPASFVIGDSATETAQWDTMFYLTRLPMEHF